MPVLDSIQVLDWARTNLPPAYAAVLEALSAEAANDSEVSGLLLTGSVARRDALPGTDVDVRVIVRSGPPGFGATVRDGITVERTVSTAADARRRLNADSMHVYAYLDGVVLYADGPELAELRSTAQAISASFRTPADRRREIAEQLRHPEEKLRVALAAGDLYKATYTLDTVSWQLIEGLWAANDLPLPPNASVRPHLPDLSGPPDVESWFERMFLGAPADRAAAGLHLLTWISTGLSDGC